MNTKQRLTVSSVGLCCALVFTILAGPVGAWNTTAVLASAGEPYIADAYTDHDQYDFGDTIVVEVNVDTTATACQKVDIWAMLRDPTNYGQDRDDKYSVNICDQENDYHTFHLSIPPSGEPGDWDVWIVVRDSDTYKTYDETHIYVQVASALPDLYLIELSVSPYIVYEGDTVEWTAQIKNGGDADTEPWGPFHMQLLVSESTICEWSVENVPAEGTTTKKCTWTAGGAGDYIARAEVDSEGEIPESNESNNPREQGFTVRPLPTNAPTATPEPTVTPLPTNTSIPTAKPTVTPLPTNTSVPTPLLTSTPVPTAKPTVTPLRTNTPIPTPLPTSTPVPTAKPTVTPPPTSPSPTDTSTPSQLVRSGIHFTVEHNGSIFHAFSVVDTSAPPLDPQQWDDMVTTFNQIYGRRNWLVLDDTGQLVHDTRVCADVIVAAETAFMGATAWNPDNLRSKASLYRGSLRASYTLDVLQAIGNMAGKLVLVLSVGEAQLVSTVGEAAARAVAERFAESLLETVVDEYTSPSALVRETMKQQLRACANRLEEAAELIDPLQTAFYYDSSPREARIRSSDMATFHDLVTIGDADGYAALIGLTRMYDKGFGGYLKDVALSQVGGGTVEDLAVQIWKASQTQPSVRRAFQAAQLKHQELKLQWEIMLFYADVFHEVFETQGIPMGWEDAPPLALSFEAARELPDVDLKLEPVGDTIAVREEAVSTAEGIVGQGDMAGHSISTESNERLRITLSYPDGDLDLHLYDSQGQHIGLNYETGEIEIEAGDAEYSGADANPEWIQVAQPQDGDWLVLVHAAEAAAPESYVVQIASDDKAKRQAEEAETEGPIELNCVLCGLAAMLFAIITAAGVWIVRRGRSSRHE
jgi:hypothetical protein